MTVIHSLKTAWHASIAEIDPHGWNALCQQRDRPFLLWEWLSLLEESGSVGPGTGWQPCHLTISSRNEIVACAALYLKTHSNGEFVFDEACLRRAASMGVMYYPKLVGMVPFTPVTAYRFLIAPGVDEVRMSLFMAREIECFCRNQGLSGSGFHFVTPGWGRIMEGLGYQVRLHQGFVWLNAGFLTFEDYLAGLKASHRRSIRRERASLRKEGIWTQRLFAGEAPAGYLSLMYDLYARHNDQFGEWSCKFLTRVFFEGLRERFPNNVLIIAAYASHDPHPLAMSLLIVAGDRVFGRYWGAREHVNFLHFELCYYQPMEWMIHKGLRFFDPGMGGVHKAFRGFVSAPSFSLHAFRDPRLHQAAGCCISGSNLAEMREIAGLNSILPYKDRHSGTKAKKGR